ncbi:MAG: methyltransferase domain-containing protein [Clostridiales bacterium]|nr:methyltransferase domain-containing protein [Clostridiales bacterium]
MKNTKMYDTKNVLNQYKNSKNLNTRISIYDKYKKGGNSNAWIQDTYTFFDGCSILEFGSGSGKDWKNNILEVSEKYYLTLSDFSQGMVDELKSKYGKYSNVEIMQMDIQNAPIEDDSKDFIIANAMLYHVPDKDKALNEVKRILKPDGIFYATTMGSKSIFHYLKETLHEAASSASLPYEISFTLQNGKKYLNKYFSDVKIIYDRGLVKITDTKDLIDFIYSIPSIEGLEEKDRNKITEYYEKKKNNDGFITIEIEYGMFVAQI